MNTDSHSEEDTKRLYITPALEGKWDKQLIKMEVQITDGRIDLRGTPHRDSKSILRADYVLYAAPNVPLAVVEAKRERNIASHGMQQAIEYAQMMKVPFAYSANGESFHERDLLTGSEREFPLSSFPSKEELEARWQREENDGQGMSEAEKNILLDVPFYSDENSYPPRYYQQIAVNETLRRIAQGKRRVLLVMATGTGKTYTAFQIVWRLLKAGTVKKVLYLADRNILVNQPRDNDFKPLKDVCHKVDFAADMKAGQSSITAYQVYFALYQQLMGRSAGGVDEAENSTAQTASGADDAAEANEAEKADRLEHLRALFPNRGFFDLIIVDECHRGSIRADGLWHEVLEYFEGAVQVGMTATPVEKGEDSCSKYFSESTFTYSLMQGIKDGYLAPYFVNRILTDTEEWTPTDEVAERRHIEKREYNTKDFGRVITLQDRIDKIAWHITDFLKSNGPMSKTIVFCETEDEAARMRDALVNCNKDMVKEHPDYVVRITSSDEYGKRKLLDFQKAEYPVIATTSCLLSTGVDAKTVELIVLEKNIGSKVEFKQIIGRGTRLCEEQGKLCFTIMDFKGATNLFLDKDWDGEGEIIQNDTKPHPPKPTPPGEGIQVITKTDRAVHITSEQVMIYDTENRLLVNENIIDYTKHNILEKYADLKTFIARWTAADKKKEIADIFADEGIRFDKIKKQQNMDNVDDFDFICFVAFGKKPLTRRERAESVKKRDIFSKYGDAARKVLDILLDKYMNEGIYDVENPYVFGTRDFADFGKPSKIARLFGGGEEFRAALKELESALYAA